MGKYHQIFESEEGQYKCAYCGTVIEPTIQNAENPESENAAWLYLCTCEYARLEVRLRKAVEDKKIELESFLKDKEILRNRIITEDKLRIAKAEVVLLEQELASYSSAENPK